MKKVVHVSSLIFALLIALVSQALAGGKAEPLAIEFKNNSSTATLSGTLRGDVQFDYSVAARQGQWLMVEVSATPQDAATFIVKDPQDNETTAQYRWSSVVKQTGDYLLWVSKPADYKTCKYTLKVTLLSARPAAMNYSASDKEGAAFYGAMRRFIDAARKKDRAAFLTLFSRAKPFYELNPMNIGSKKYFRHAVSYTELAADLKKKTGVYWTYLERGENGNRDAFTDNMPDGKMWTRVAGNKFVPPGAEITGNTYVKWRKEGTRWVIDEISYPQA